MNEITPEQMMHYMMQSRKEAFYLMVIIYTLLVITVVAVLLLINRFLLPAAVRPVVWKIVLIFAVVVYAAGITSRWTTYKQGHKNQRPWSGGIYEAYYECSKCESLYGGIFGKGPTQHIIKDNDCVHDWQALYKKDFMRKFPELMIPDGFTETEPPKPHSDEWYALNRSPDVKVTIVNRRLEVDREKRTSVCKLKIPNGTLIGIDNGEWGGKLTFEPDDNAQESSDIDWNNPETLFTSHDNDIKTGNIRFLFRFGEKIYFMESLAHLDISEGTLYELEVAEGNRFTYTKLIDFEDAPEALAVYRDKLLIASFKNFYVIHNFEKELIFENAFWNGLYPNSIAVFNEKNVFVGIRGGIVKLNLINKTFKFYKNIKVLD